jgi:hypothetical protein
MDELGNSRAGCYSRTKPIRAAKVSRVLSSLLVHANSWVCSTRWSSAYALPRWVIEGGWCIASNQTNLAVGLLPEETGNDTVISSSEARANRSYKQPPTRRKIAQGGRISQGSAHGSRIAPTRNATPTATRWRSTGRNARPAGRSLSPPTVLVPPRRRGRIRSRGCASRRRSHKAVLLLSHNLHPRCRANNASPRLSPRGFPGATPGNHPACKGWAAA